ncbi:hypothetical protein CHUAL_003829 [Chamberlinius hualienensis]
MADVRHKNDAVEYSQLIGSIYNLINGQILLAECFADTSESIRNSLNQLTKSVDELKSDVGELNSRLNRQSRTRNAKSMDHLKHVGNEMIRVNSSSAIPAAIVAPQLANEVLQRLNSVTVKLNKLTPNDLLNKDGNLNSVNGCKNFHRMLSASIKNPLTSSSASDLADGNGKESLPPQTMNGNSIIIKTEVLKLNDSLPSDGKHKRKISEKTKQTRKRSRYSTSTRAAKKRKEKTKKLKELEQQPVPLPDRTLSSLSSDDSSSSSDDCVNYSKGGY